MKTGSLEGRIPLPLLRLLLGPNVESLTSYLLTSSFTLADARWLKHQGLSAYLYHSLRERDLLPLLSKEVAAFLQESYYHEALVEALQHKEVTSSVLDALNQAGVETVLMKGMALAHTVYPSPRCRPKGDLDLWIRPEQREAAIQALKQLGYYTHDHVDRPPALKLLYGGDQLFQSQRPGTGDVELQWPAIRGEWVRQVAKVDHEGIWNRKVAIKIENQTSHIMVPEDLLLHLCIHEAINHRFGSPWLRSLLDIHLLVQAYSLHWEEVVERARAWRVATPVWTMLTLAQTLCETPLPSTVLEALSPPYLKQQLIYQFRLADTMSLGVTGYSSQRLFILLTMVDHSRDVLQLIYSNLLPERPWIQARYNVNHGPALWYARLLHPFRFLYSTRV